MRCVSTFLFGPFNTLYLQRFEKVELDIQQAKDKAQQEIREMVCNIACV